MSFQDNKKNKHNVAVPHQHDKNGNVHYLNPGYYTELHSRNTCRLRKFLKTTLFTFVLEIGAIAVNSLIQFYSFKRIMTS